MSDRLMLRMLAIGLAAAGAACGAATAGRSPEVGPMHPGTSGCRRPRGLAAAAPAARRR